MTTILVAFVLAFVGGVIATRLAIALAPRLGMIDKPDGYRKMHEKAIPRLGGPAVYIAFCLPLLGLLWFSGLSEVSKTLFTRSGDLWVLVLGSSMALLLGAVDDKLDLRPRWKLLWQVLIACAVYYFGFSIKAISNPFGDRFELGIFSLPVTVFWFVGCMNAVNLLDGLDGLAAGACLFVTVTLFLVNLLFTNTFGMLLMASVSGAILGFLVFNFPPARIFLGDSGSLLLGFLIASLSVIGGTRKAETAVALFIPIVALGLPIFDTALAIVRRWYKRLPLSSPDREHVHHALVGMGYSKRRVVLTLYLICLILGGAAVLISLGRSEVVILVLGSLGIVVFVSVRLFSGLRISDVLDKMSLDKLRKEMAAEARAVLGRAVESMKQADDLDAIWKISGGVFEALGCCDAGLMLNDEAGAQIKSFSWQKNADAGGERKRLEGDYRSAELGIRLKSGMSGLLFVREEIGDNEVGAELLEMIGPFRDKLAEEIGRVLADGKR
jgi:UDP-GlcNAc:undecaprenyl-phosphate GlcNAc-1-phosphate transferase